MSTVPQPAGPPAQPAGMRTWRAEVTGGDEQMPAWHGEVRTADVALAEQRALRLATLDGWQAGPHAQVHLTPVDKPPPRPARYCSACRSHDHDRAQCSWARR